MVKNRVEIIREPGKAPIVVNSRTGKVIRDYSKAVPANSQAGEALAINKQREVETQIELEKYGKLKELSPEEYDVINKEATARIQASQPQQSRTSIIQASDIMSRTTKATQPQPGNMPRDYRKPVTPTGPVSYVDIKTGQPKKQMSYSDSQGNQLQGPINPVLQRRNQTIVQKAQTGLPSHLNPIEVNYSTNKKPEMFASVSAADDYSNIPKVTPLVPWYKNQNPIKIGEDPTIKYNALVKERQKYADNSEQAKKLDNQISKLQWLVNLKQISQSITDTTEQRLSQHPITSALIPSGVGYGFAIGGQFLKAITASSPFWGEVALGAEKALPIVYGVGMYKEYVGGKDILGNVYGGAKTLEQKGAIISNVGTDIGFAYLGAKSAQLTTYVLNPKFQLEAAQGGRASWFNIRARPNAGANAQEPGFFNQRFAIEFINTDFPKLNKGFTAGNIEFGKGGITSSWSVPPVSELYSFYPINRVPELQRAIEFQSGKNVKIPVEPAANLIQAGYADSLMKNIKPKRAISPETKSLGGKEGNIVLDEFKTIIGGASAETYLSEDTLKTFNLDSKQTTGKPFTTDIDANTMFFKANQGLAKKLNAVPNKKFFNYKVVDGQIVPETLMIKTKPGQRIGTAKAVEQEPATDIKNWWDRHNPFTNFGKSPYSFGKPILEEYTPQIGRGGKQATLQSTAINVAQNLGIDPLTGEMVSASGKNRLPKIGAYNTELVKDGAKSDVVKSYREAYAEQLKKLDLGKGMIGPPKKTNTLIGKSPRVVGIWSNFNSGPNSKQIMDLSNVLDQSKKDKSDQSGKSDKSGQSDKKPGDSISNSFRYYSYNSYSNSQSSSSTSSNSFQSSSQSSSDSPRGYTDLITGAGFIPPLPFGFPSSGGSGGSGKTNRLAYFDELSFAGSLLKGFGIVQEKKPRKIKKSKKSKKMRSAWDYRR